MAKRVRVQPRFFVFLLLILAGIVFLSVQAFGQRTFEVITTVVGDVKTVSAVLVREETVRPSDISFTPYFYVAEGEDVVKDQPIAEMKNESLTKTKEEELKKVREDIAQQQARSLQDDVKNADRDNLNAQIDELTTQIGGVIRGESSGRLIELEKQLRTIMDQRQEYMRKNAFTDAELKKLYDKETQLQNSISTWTTTVNAEVDGRLSLQFDRYEELFKPDYLARLTPTNIREFLNGKTKTTDTVDKLFRIVNPFKWYVCALSTDTKWQPGVDTAVNVTFDGYVGEYSGKVLSVGRDDKNKDLLVVLEMHQDIASLINVRKVTARIGDQMQGLAVPQRALQSVEGVTCVVLAESRKAIPVTVLNHDKKYVLVAPVEENALTKGMKVVLK